MTARPRGSYDSAVGKDEFADALRDLRMHAGHSAEPVQRALDRVATAELASRSELERLQAENQRLASRVSELENALVARDEMLSVVGHELRNPIAPVFLHVRTLLLEAREAGKIPLDPARLIQRLERIEHYIQRFVDVLERILDFSRLSSGRIELVLDTLDLTTVAREVAAGFEREASAAGCELRVAGTGPLVGRWDRVRLEQIISNLVSNAVRYGAGAPIDIEVRAAGQNAKLSVRDHGVGIALEDQRRIFDRFERVKQRTSPGGFGVGLWVVKTLCDALGGTITVESTPGDGATFTVSLPRGTPLT